MQAAPVCMYMGNDEICVKNYYLGKVTKMR